MSDLVQILRAYIPGEPAHEEVTAERIAQAADEIERLRKALEQIAYYDDFLSSETAGAMMNIARAALILE